MSMHVDKELRGNEKSGMAGKGELFYLIIFSIARVDWKRRG